MTSPTSSSVPDRGQRPTHRGQRPTGRQRVDAYFDSIGWKPFRFQRSAWKAYQSGASGLVHSATGTGKTLAVWLGPILRWLDANRDASVWDARKPPPLTVIWITPLRALAGDTEAALRAPLQALDLPWQLDRRTGDSKSSVKARLLKKLPTALITTPESLSLMLTHQRLLPQLASAESIIVDEWHELLGTKRGIQTELALARLRGLNPKLQTWGVSATLGNLEEAANSLIGPKPSDQIRIIQGYRKKKVQLRSIIPERIERFPWSGHIGTKMVPQVAQALETADSALVFANTRSQTEIWYQRLLADRPQWAGRIALHHGSLDAKVRQWVESGLKDGRLKAVVCTSSLDLGVDFTAVDLVIQIGSPKGAARLLQRAGRSGHQPQATSRLSFVPTNAIELIELAAAKDAIARGDLESKPALEKPLDVLAQHLVSVGIGGGFEPRAMLREVRQSHAYRNLSDLEWQWVLDFVVRGGQSLDAYPEFKRVEIQQGRYVVADQRTIRMHRMSIGTIVSDAAMKIQYLKGGTLGTAEEHFLSKLNPGDRFLFAGRLVRLVRIRDNVAYVKRATGAPDSVPRWYGGRMPLSSELSDALRRKLEEAAEGRLVGPEMKALAGLFEIQKRWSVLPARDELLIERVKTRGGFQAFLFPFEGRLVHEGLAALLAYRLSRHQPITLSMACNDYGLVLQSPSPLPIESSLAAGLLSPHNLGTDIESSMNSTEMAKRQFREIARIAGLVHAGYTGQQKSARNLQASSNLFFDVFREYDPENLLLHQSRREVLERQLETSRMKAALRRLAECRIVITDPPKVTPLAFPLLVDKLRERLSSETLADRIARMQASLEKAADA
ncbi:ligase-associated DNA damage response DEXH box helicase [Roseiconus nitratireducens]|uniref:Ligase-associated DNA damage response DEXH box helicase n=1 Tax=Roseiconus nitratireducens TaxID=2605748 RepID=A0A5M6CVQ0_9BACT|nr:ligase-associated DNA damage response DEXH box helicase [Roseiconus nitratireducens]KAA5539301.1 ligase-associated DNA damage response DEXH box helicase [Roseiconus nitratireducens]